MRGDSEMLLKDYKLKSIIKDYKDYNSEGSVFFQHYVL